MQTHSKHPHAITTARASIPLGKPPSRWLGRRGPTGALLIPPTHAQPLLGAELELAVQVFAGVLAMDEVAEAAAHAAVARVEAAAGFAEIGHRAELAIDGPRGVPPAVELVAGFLCRVLVLETGVDVADEV